MFEGLGVMSKFKHLTHADSTSFLLANHIEELSKTDAMNIEHRDMQKRGIGSHRNFLIAEVKMKTHVKPDNTVIAKTDSKKDTVTL